MQRSTARLAREIFLFVLLFSGGARPEALSASEIQSGISVAPDDILSGQVSGAEDFFPTLAGRGRATAECFQLRPGSVGNTGGKARRCEPQSLPFARCRSGITSCRRGHENGPLTWFSCEKERGNTSLTPRPGSILILAANGHRNMPTGHVAYVEEVVAQSDTAYRLIFTHTNHDRRCSLESHIEATYDSAARTLDIHGGAWGAWGKGLPVAGFILD
ncbi:MAG: CHAP domain-containing protein [Pseudomonadota bacterium]